MRRALVIGFALTLTACAARRGGESATPTKSVAPSAPPAASAVSAPTGTGADADQAKPSAEPSMKAPSSAPVAGGASGTVVMPTELATAQAQLDSASKAFAAAGNDCLSLCKSLGSMTNATEHLCGLVEGTTDQQRCLDARARLQAAQAKVKSTCGSTCAGAGG